MTLPEPTPYRLFRIAFRTYYNLLCNYAFTFTKSFEVSEDIVQDLFAKIWEDRRELLEETNLRYYLFTAVRNNCISWLRKEKRFVTVEWEEINSPADLSWEPSFPERKSQDEKQLLHQAIGQLPPKCREVFLLSRMGKLSYKEIALSLGISVKTVENQLGKALKLLRAFLKEHGICLSWIIMMIFLLLHRGNAGFSVFS